MARRPQGPRKERGPAAVRRRDAENRRRGQRGMPQLPEIPKRPRRPQNEQ